MTIVTKKNGHANFGRGSTKNNNGNIIKLPSRVKALVNFILSSDLLRRIFHETCPTAPVRMAKNRILSNLVS